MRGQCGLAQCVGGGFRAALDQPMHGRSFLLAKGKLLYRCSPTATVVFTKVRLLLDLHLALFDQARVFCNFGCEQRAQFFG